MGLDRQVRAARLEDREHRGHPVQVALGHHGDDAFAAVSSRQQGSRQLIGNAVELPVGPVTVAVHGRDAVRLRAYALLEELVDSAVRQRLARTGETIEMEV